LHATIEPLILFIFEGVNHDLRLHVLKDCGLLDKIALASKANEAEVAKPKGMRLGNMGHITNISTFLLSAAAGNPDLESFMQQNAEWTGYVNGALAAAKERENSQIGYTGQGLDNDDFTSDYLAPGQASGGGYSIEDEDEDSEEEEDDDEGVVMQSRVTTDEEQPEEEWEEREIEEEQPKEVKAEVHTAVAAEATSMQIEPTQKEIPQTPPPTPATESEQQHNASSADHTKPADQKPTQGTDATTPASTTTESSSPKKKLSQEEVEKIFSQYDKNNSGTISHDELAEIAKDLKLDLRPDEIESAIKTMDDDNDGTISKQEFLNWFAILAETFGKSS